MLTLRMIQGVTAFNRSWGLDGGACFGVSDPSRLRPHLSSVLLVPPIESAGPRRRIVMTDDGHGNMVPDDQHAETKKQGVKKSVPAMRPAKKKKTGK